MTSSKGHVSLTTRQLEVFVEVAENCSFADAADRLDISQAAVSNHIAALEKELRCTLFVRRKGSSPTLSFVGARYLAEVTRFMQATREMAAAPMSSRQIMLRGYAGNHVLDCFLKPALGRFHEAHPDIALSFTTEMPSKGIAASLENRSLDFAFYPAASDALHEKATVLAELESAIYCRSDLPRGALDSLGLILPNDGSVDSMTLAKHIADTPFASRPVDFHTQYASVTVELAAAGKGLAPLLSTMVATAERGNELMKVCDLPSWLFCLQTSSGLRKDRLLALSRFANDAIGEVNAMHGRSAE